MPLELLSAPWREDGKILMLEPRRLATRAAATRMASLLDEPVGRTVGYRTRIDAAVSPATRIEVITEGLLLRRLQSDPGLDGVAAVILDEIHERSLESDLALALCLDLRKMLRPELRLLAMSATADGARLAPLMDAAIIESTGRMFPVEIRHAKTDIAIPRDLPDAMARAIRAALAEHMGDILAFLPGMAEIRRTQTALDRCGADVLPLHGDLPPAEQDRALRPSDRRRVVLATSIAETSLTVPGVRIVVDGGWRRVPRLDASTGLTRLVTVRVSRASADQRAGRSGREAPGVAIRLWTPALQRGLAPFDRPEILEAELSSLVLDCAAWGTPPAALAFQDQPPAGALTAATALLTELGALELGAKGGASSGGRITPAGQRMAALGAHPRLAAMMLAAETPGEQALAADLAALLEERDPLRGAEAPADIGLRLLAIRHGDPEADRGALAAIRRTAGQYRRRLRLSAGLEAEGDPGRLLAAAFPDRVGQRRGEPGSFRFSGGGGGRMPRTDSLASVPLLVAAALDVKAAARIRLAAPLDAGSLPAALEARVTEQVEAGFDPVSGAVLARRRRRLGALVLSDRTVPVDPAEVAVLLADTVAAQALKPLPMTDSVQQFRARVALMRALEPATGPDTGPGADAGPGTDTAQWTNGDPRPGASPDTGHAPGTSWPDLSDTALIASARDWLAPHLHGMARLSDLARLDLTALLRGLLSWKQAARLDQALPLHLTLPHGRAPVDYTQPVPIAEARAQAFYGMVTTPRLAGGRIPLRLALLSPAGRPIAVTADLASFWKNAWADARRDMRGRYPKHDWPEDGGTSG